ncbi:MAG: FxDxF family PEP-CTERM protein [Aquabacterium sp.]
MLNVRTLIAGLAAAAVTSGALAADQTVAFSSNVASFASSSVSGLALVGGDDVITFDSLMPGNYDFTLTLSGQWLTITNAHLNGITGTIIDSGRWTFIGIDGVTVSPLVLTLTGTRDRSSALYSGELTVTAVVPEPGTYALMLAGLGAVGFVARRRRVA